MRRNLLLLCGVAIVLAGTLAIILPSAKDGRTRAYAAPTHQTTDGGTQPPGPNIALPAPARPHPAKSAPVPKPGKGQRLLTIVNRMPMTIWPAAAPNPAHPMAATGWRLDPGASVSVIIPDHWNARVWGRTGCTFDRRGVGHCQTGDCNGRLQCGNHWGRLPATLGEFNLNAWMGMDFYDVSLVDGNNLPMYINHTGGHTPDKISSTGCGPGGCTRDANATCPRVLQETANGKVIDCRSSCLAFGTDQYCCRAHWASRANCRPDQWPVNSAAVFKRAEPFAYSYVNDDATSVFVCKGECSYRITFGVTPT